MKALFYALSVVVIAAGIYFTSSTKSKLEDQQQTRLDLIERNEKLAENIETTEEQVDTEQGKLEDANRNLAEVEQSLANLRSKEQSLQRDLGDLDGRLEEQQAELAAAEEARQEVQRIFNEELGLQGEVRMSEISERVSELEDQKKNLVNELSELDTNIEGARSSIDRNRAEITRLAERKAERDSRIRRNAMESVVTAVDQDWGFVVIGAGSNSGFTPQTRLLVKRDGRQIAEVEPSSIEASQTIAEIDYDTLDAGARIQPGDRVILSEPAGN